MTTAVEHASITRAGRVQTGPHVTRRGSTVRPRAEQAPRHATEPTAPASDPTMAPSQVTGLVFQAILFFAAALSLIAVIQQVRANAHPDTGVDAPPPAVFVTTD